MFEENFKNIELTDGEIYFLAGELKLGQIVGLGIDYAGMNKEMKMSFRQESYDLLEKHEAIQMDFSGNTTVDTNYASVVKAFEKPEHCFVVQHKDMKTDISDMRKIYLNDGIYTALEYVDENVCRVYQFDNVSDSNQFLLFNLHIDAKLTEHAEVNFEKYKSVEEIIDDCNEFAIITEYVRVNDTYKCIEYIYVNMSDEWYYLEGDENNIHVNPVTEQVTVF
ncbi:MAG: hypothetical protein ACI4W6_10155 [Acutalibacteraceae bacterium]